MTVDRWVRSIAGLLVLTSAALAWLHSPWWLVFTGFVGVNLFQYGLTDFCPMKTLLVRLGAPSGRA